MVTLEVRAYWQKWLSLENVGKVAACDSNVDPWDSTLHILHGCTLASCVDRGGCRGTSSNQVFTRVEHGETGMGRGRPQMRWDGSQKYTYRA